MNNEKRKRVRFVKLCTLICIDYSVPLKLEGDIKHKHNDSQSIQSIFIQLLGQNELKSHTAKTFCRYLIQSSYLLCKNDVY